MKLSNLFSRKEKSQFDVQEVAEATQQPIAKELFIDEEKPELNLIDDEQSIMDKFLQRNHWGMGYSYGNEYQSAEILHAHVNKLKSDFHQIIDKRRSELEDTLKGLELGQVRGENISNEVDQYYSNLINKCKESIKELITEKDLASVGQGRIEKVINDFTLGFKEGTYLALKESVLKVKVNI
jgi:hypothetical protein